MKKMLFIFTVLVAINLSANNILMSWNCQEIVISLYENNKMKVRDIMYDIKYCDDGTIDLMWGGLTLLTVTKEVDGTIVVTNSDNSEDCKRFTRCY